MTRNSSLPTLRSSGGFSLIELMIGIMLGLVVLGALTTFFVSSSAARHEIERNSRQIENGRFAIDAVRGEVHVAGFYAELSQGGATYTMADPCATALANLGFSLNPAFNVPLPISGYTEDTGPIPACITDRVKFTDVLVVRRVNTETVAAPGKAGRFYFQSSRCKDDSTTIPWVFDVGGSGTFQVIKQVNCTAFAPLYMYRVEVFYIRDWSLAKGDGIPTLVKLELDPNPDPPFNAAGVFNAGIVTLPIVEGIEDMRLEYGIDNDGDGSPDEYRRCDAAVPCTIAQWSNVVAVRVNVLAKNLEQTLGWKDVKIYDMGSGKPRTVGPFGDAFRRNVFSAIVTLPNRTGPREN